MERFSILTNRKRAIVALVHSIVFLLIALRGLISAPMVGLLREASPHASQEVLAVVYFVVTTILAILLRYSGCLKEKLYFAFCTTSAGTGLLRSLMGDTGWHIGPQLRVLMLLCAVITGSLIIRDFGIADVPATLEP